MKPVTTLFAAATMSLATLGATTAQAAGISLLNEGFASVAALDGWVQVNQSAPAGSGWFQGNSGIFGAQSGPADAYAAASFLGAANGSGTVDNWLITPVLDLNGPTELSFYTRNANEPGFDDVLEVRFSSGSGTDTSGFTTVLATLGGAGGFPGSWQQFVASVTQSGTGRFAFRYVGAADTLSYIGLDTVSIVTAVPEPSAWMLLALGGGMLHLVRRRARPQHAR